ncbi:outer membrane protein assembly factor BamB family protein [Breznakiellaceae bacterium SP9]
MHRNTIALSFIVLFSLVSALGAQEQISFAEEPQWREALGGAVICLPSSQAGSVTVALDGGNLKTYSWNGKKLWEYYAGGKLQPYLTRSLEGTSYVGRTNGSLIAINRVGKELWVVKGAGRLSAPVIIGWDGRIFVNCGRNISCYTASGYKLWTVSLPKAVLLNPALDAAGGLIVVLQDNTLVHLDKMGRAVSRQLFGTPQAVLPLTLEERPLVLAAFSDGTLELIDVQASEAAPPSPTPSQLPALPKLTAQVLAAKCRDGYAAFALADGKLMLLDAAAGTFIGTGDCPLGAATRENTVMQWDERGIYVLSKNGAASFSSQGKRRWLLELKNAADIPAFSDEGFLYSGGGDWILYAYHLEEGVRKSEQSIYGPAPEGSYGFGKPGPSPWADNYYQFDEAHLGVILEEIAGAIKEGRVGKNEQAYTSYLMEVAGALRTLPHSRSTHPPVTIKQRVQALILLSYIGSRETVPFLAELFTQDKEVLIKAAAAEAISRIGVDPDGLALRSFNNGIMSPLMSGETRILLAIAKAAGALCRFSGPPLADAGIRILSTLSGPALPNAVRKQAQKELESLHVK